MISYLDNVDGMNEAINRKRARYTNKQRKTDRRDKAVDLTGLNVIGGSGQSSASDKTLRATVSGRNNQPVFTTVKEDSGGGVVPDYQNVEDEYSKYDEMWDGFADQQLINSGATIISSTLELTDSSGRNRTLVRRDDNEADYY